MTESVITSDQLTAEEINAITQEALALENAKPVACDRCHKGTYSWTRIDGSTGSGPCRRCYKGVQTPAQQRKNAEYDAWKALRTDKPVVEPAPAPAVEPAPAPAVAPAEVPI